MIIIRLTNLVLSYMIKDSSKKRQYSIVNVGSVQSYLGIPYRSACYINFIFDMYNFYNNLYKQYLHFRISLPKKI